MILGWATSAHDIITTPITFSREISRLLYSRCVTCHRQGGRAFSLITFQEARPWAAAIKEEVLERRMPPWGAVKGFGEFRNDEGLTQEQISLIAEWVEGGAPEGDPELLPRVPDFSQPRLHGRHDGAETPAEILVYGALILKSALTLTGIEPKDVPEGSSIMVVADRPDGGIEPLLWLYNYKARFAHPFRYTASLHLPAGTKIEVSPPGAATIRLLTQGRRKPALP